MKVLFINTVFGKGSTGRIVKEIGEAVEQNGGEYRVAYGRGKVEDKHGYRIGNDIELYAHAFLSRITDRAGFYSKGATKKLIKYIRKYNPDVIHLHNLHGYYLHIGVLFDYLKNEYKGKIVWTLHDCWAFTGHCVHYTYAKCNKWKSGCDHCPEQKRYPSSLMMDNSHLNYEQKKSLLTGLGKMTIVAPSEWLARQAKISFLGDYSVSVINNGIDLDTFRILDDQRRNSQHKIVLNIMDGLDDRKGYEDLVKLSQILSGNYRVMIIGLSEEDCAKAPESIIAVKKTSSVDELVKYYNEAFCFVNPTYEDTFPTVNLEALACGIPVITYNSCGSPEVVVDNCGIVVDAGDVEGLKNAIESITFTPLQCRARAIDYDKRNSSNKYLALYK